MKKYLSLVALAATLALFAPKVHAAVGAPLDQQGHALATIDWVGALPCNIDNSTGTGGIRCGAAGRGVVYGVIYTGINLNDYLVLRDSDTANKTANSTATVVYASSGAVSQTGTGTTGMVKFPVPIRFSNGIVSNASAAPVAGGTAMWTILYRPLSAGE